MCACLSPQILKLLLLGHTQHTQHKHKQPANQKKVLLCGIEAHVCVLQTALDLLDRGLEVHLLVDGISSQRAGDRAVGLQRAMQVKGVDVCFVGVCAVRGVRSVVLRRRRR